MTDMIDGLVLPYMKLLSNTLFEVLPNKAPIRELKAREVEAKKVAADMVLEITVRHELLSFISTCKYPLELLHAVVKLNHVTDA